MDCLSVVAPEIRNLEAYSADFHSVSLRYDLPLKPKGVPKYVQVICCDAFLDYAGCTSNISEIAKCKLWPDKFCIELQKLPAHRSLKIAVSLKNLDTHAFGPDTKVKMYTANRGKQNNAL